MSFRLAAFMRRFRRTSSRLARALAKCTCILASCFPTLVTAFAAAIASAKIPLKFRVQRSGEWLPLLFALLFNRAAL